MLWPDCARFTNACYKARIEGYGQDYLDLLFKSIVPSQLTNGLLINDASRAGISFSKEMSQKTLHLQKTNYSFFLGQFERKLYDKIYKNELHPLYNIYDCKGLFSQVSKKDTSTSFYFLGMIK